MRCGYRSGYAAFFREAIGGAACLGCTTAEGPRWRWKPRLNWETLATAAILILGVAVSREDGRATPTGAFLGLMAGLWLGRPAAIAVHELGHAVAAWLTGARVTMIRVGLGEPLAHLDAGPTRFELGRDLFGGGHVQRYFDNPPRNRWRVIAISAAGGLANLLVAPALLLAGLNSMAGAATAVPAILGAALGGMAFSQAACAWEALWPRHWATEDGGQTGNDGRSIQAALETGVDVQAERLAVHYYRMEVLGRRRDYAGQARLAREAWAANPDDSFNACRWLDRLLRTEGPGGTVRAGQAAGLGKPEAPRLDDLCWAIAETNIAWAALLAADLPLAGALSAATMEAYPDNPGIAGTRGAVLTALGEAEAGAPLLRKGVRELTDGWERAGLCRWLGRAETALGNPGLGEEYGRLADWLETR